MESRQRTSLVKRLLGPALIALGGAISSPAATLPIYINSSPLVSPPAIAPQIDARIWVNQSPFDVTFNSLVTPLPFESLNTLFFTNAPGPAGVMSCSPGFRFVRNTGGQALWMGSWENQGTITTDHRLFLNGFGRFSIDSSASILLVRATNIVSTGPLLSSGTFGLVHLEGKKVDVSYCVLRTATVGDSGILFNAFQLYTTNGYVNDAGISDIYWGAGTNQFFDGDAPPLFVGGSGGGAKFDLPVPASPSHEVEGLFGNSGAFRDITSVPQGSFFDSTELIAGKQTFSSGYAAVANRTQTNPTNTVVQVVFYPLQPEDTNLITDVRFSGGVPSTVVVGFRSSSADITTPGLSAIDDSVYLIDALGVSTNVYLSPNLDGQSSRPNSYQLSRLMPSQYASGSAGNIPFTPDLLVKPTYVLPTVTNFYTAYAARVELASKSPSGVIPYDPTNMPGRVEVFGDTVNLDNTRMRAESSVVIRAKSLSSNRLAQVDAPNVVFDVGSVHPSLVVSNLAPTTVRRLNGIVRAWSATWTNYEGIVIGGFPLTNTIRFHVLIVDNRLSTIVPVTVNEFAARGSNIVVTDNLNIGKSFLISGDSLHLVGGLTLPTGVNLKSNNLVNIRNFTNDGIINISGTENMGADRPLPYSNYVNRGTNSAASHSIRTANLDNPGCLVAESGLITINAVTASLQGKAQSQFTRVETNFLQSADGIVTNITSTLVVLSAAPKIRAADIQIFARDLSVSNSLIEGGRLSLSVTNRLLDAGTNAINHWSVTGGFNVSRRPTTSDLLGTHLRSTTTGGAVNHYWAGLNRGAITDGFSNNLALGKLTLDAASGSQMRFFSAGAGNAIYVDYLDLVNAATNVNALLTIASDFTIYFANSSLPATKIDGAVGGRLRWVRDYTGPLSSTNLVYFFTNGLTVTSNVYTFNTALVTSRDLDSDGDGIVNALDPTPVYVAQNAQLAVSLRFSASAGGTTPYALLSWTALAHSSNYVEYRTSAAGSSWEVLTNFLFEDCYTGPASVMDPLPGDGALRLYRLRVDPGPFGVPCDY